MTTKKQATKPTATARYTERHAESQDLLKRIAQQLARHRKEQADDPGNWGFPGDLGHINEELAQVLASLGDRSAVEAMGLDC